MFHPVEFSQYRSAVSVGREANQYILLGLCTSRCKSGNRFQLISCPQRPYRRNKYICDEINKRLYFINPAVHFKLSPYACLFENIIRNTLISNMESISRIASLKKKSSNSDMGFHSRVIRVLYIFTHPIVDYHSVSVRSAEAGDNSALDPARPSREFRHSLLSQPRLEPNSDIVIAP